MALIATLRRPALWFGMLVILALSACSRANPDGSETISHPDRPDAAIEFFAEAPSGSGPHPTVILLHGFQGGSSTPGGESFVRWGVLKRYAEKGYLAVSVSLPGYGGSDGPADFAGPATQRAVGAVIDRLVADGRASRGQVVIQGVSLGAVTPGLLAAERPDLKGVVLISGLYDLPAYFAQPGSAGAAAVHGALIAQTGGGHEALRSRSVMSVAPRIRSNLLIMNGALDDRTDAGQARRLAQIVNASGGRAQVHIYEQFGHEIPVAARRAEVDAFIDAQFTR